MCHAALRAKTKIAYQTDPNMAKNNLRKTIKKKHFLIKTYCSGQWVNISVLVRYPTSKEGRLIDTADQLFCDECGSFSRTRNTNGFSYKCHTHECHTLTNASHHWTWLNMIQTHTHETHTLTNATPPAPLEGGTKLRAPSVILCLLVPYALSAQSQDFQFWSQTL